MNGRSRIQEALKFHKTDRLPLAYEAEWEVIETLVKYFGLDKREDLGVSSASSFHSPLGERGAIGIDYEIELQRTLDVDLAKVACPVNPDKTIGNWFGMPLKYRREDGILIGAWDMQFVEKEYGLGKYIELAGYPLAGEEDYTKFKTFRCRTLTCTATTCSRKRCPNTRASMSYST